MSIASSTEAAQHKPNHFLPNAISITAQASVGCNVDSKLDALSRFSALPRNSLEVYSAHCALQGILHFVFDPPAFFGIAHLQ
jgi:hypothetical protein